jgi:uncharacterized iron-regulated membrane protein
MKRLLILVHRWTGIALCLCFAMWFASGVVLLYMPFPRLTEAERQAALPPLALAAVRIAPPQAFAAAGFESMPREATLGMLLDRPVYRLLGWDGRWHIVHADDGSLAPQVDLASAEKIAARHARAGVRGAQSIRHDQWTVPQRLDAHRPLHRVRIDDRAATVLYVSSRTGAVVLDTTRGERFWNWLGAVPHWIYPALLRQHAELWRQVVIALAAIGVAVALTGLVLGVWRWRWRAAAPGSPGSPRSPRSPYRGWTRWHHLLGLGCSVFVVTWIASGLLSMNPGRLFSDRAVPRAQLEAWGGADRAGFARGPAAALEANRPRFAPAEIGLALVAGQAWYVVHGAAGESVLVHASDPTRPPAAALDRDQLIAAARALQPAARLVAAEWLTAYDWYWYSRRGLRPLPVLRVAFADPQRTWYHIDPVRGRVLERMDGSRRAYRWWFHALHSLDFPWLVERRPLWDGVVIGLSAGGFALSVTGVVLGWRRLRGSDRRAA